MPTPEENAETRVNALHQDLINAGVITAADVADSNKDGFVSSEQNGGVVAPNGSGDYVLEADFRKAGDGDDTYLGTAGARDQFTLNNGDNGNDEGQHLNSFLDFELGTDDFRLKSFGNDYWQVSEDLSEGRINQAYKAGNRFDAEFSSARDIADLMLHINTRSMMTPTMTALSRLWASISCSTSILAVTRTLPRPTKTRSRATT